MCGTLGNILTSIESNSHFGKRPGAYDITIFSPHVGPYDFFRTRPPGNLRAWFLVILLPCGWEIRFRVYHLRKMEFLRRWPLIDILFHLVSSYFLLLTSYCPLIDFLFRFIPSYWLLIDFSYWLLIDLLLSSYWRLIHRLFTSYWSLIDSIDLLLRSYWPLIDLSKPQTSVTLRFHDCVPKTSKRFEGFNGCHRVQMVQTV